MKPAIAAVLLGLIGASAAFSAVVSVAAGSSPPGGSIILPISFVSEGSSVSAVQFDLEYDSSVMSLDITLGDIARTSGKSLYIADVISNQKRFVLCGLNQTPIPDGIAVNLFINLTTDAAPGVYPLQLSNIVGATPAGEYAQINGADGLASVQESGTVTQLWPAGVLNAATLLPGAIAPGEIVTLMGAGIGATPTQATVQLAFEGLPAPVLYAGPNQINAVVPYGVSGKDSAHLQLTTGGQDIAEFDLPVVGGAPGIFTLDASGIGPGAILNQDLTANTPSNPAMRGSFITLFAHGAGQTDPPGVDGQIPADILPKPILPVSVKIAGLDAPVQYEGAAPGMIAGVLQVNCVVPPGAPSGYSVPIVLAVGQTASQNGVTLAIK